MAENTEIMAFLVQMSEQISRQFSGIQDQINDLRNKVDRLEERLDRLEHRVDMLDIKIDNVEKNLNERIDSVEKNLNAKIDMVYHIACENRDNMKEIRREIDELLIPYNDRNLYVNEQISKISELEAWKEEAEKVISNHSEAIRRLQEATA